MKTLSLNLACLCVPCRARCRYCLLCSEGRAEGIPYEAGKKLAERLRKELREDLPGLDFGFYIGYCMDTPALADYVKTCREWGQPGGRFLQMNGFHFMGDGEIHSLMAGLAEAGIREMDFTFYGCSPCHDRFAGRTGDFDLLLRMMQSAAGQGIETHASVPLIRENLADAALLPDLLRRNGAKHLRYFLPYSKGRGRSIRDQRITAEEYAALPEEVKGSFQKTPVKTEAEWIAEQAFPPIRGRCLTLVPRADDTELAGLRAGEIVRLMEQQDDARRRAAPSAEELAKLYGDPHGRQLFRLRDLLFLWRQEHAAREGLPFMEEETQSFITYVY